MKQNIIDGSTAQRAPARVHNQADIKRIMRKLQVQLTSNEDLTDGRLTRPYRATRMIGKP